jgi:peptidoglycan/xylan/chitin deacetylase (PgdA/CDA1 family)
MADFRTRVLSLFAFVFLSSGAANAGDVALTFDDLPTLSLTDSIAYADKTTVELLDGLYRHGLPATGFVNEGKLEGEDRAARIGLLNRWLDAGMDLGNHGYSHLSLNKVPLDTYIADVARGGIVTGRLLQARGHALRWFRYPYLETGTTVETRHTFETWLAHRGYRVAPVTMENSDWMFAIPYDNAVLRNDAADTARIRASYLTYTARVVPWYRKAAVQLLGRQFTFIFLLHASRLNADCIDQLADLLEHNGLRAVSLDAAIADSAYEIADNYVGTDGNEWLSRWSLTLHKDLPWDSFPHPPSDIKAEDNRLDTSP